MILNLEIKKILKSRILKIALICLLCWIIGSIFWIIHNETWTDVETGEQIHGLSAIKQAKHEKSKWDGQITSEIIQKVLNSNKDYINSSEFNSKDQIIANIAYAKTQEYEDIRELINRSYGDFSSYDYFTVDKVTLDEAGMFYTNRVIQIQNWLKNEAVNLPDTEKEYIKKAADDLKTPFFYSYMDGWKRLMDSISIILIPLSLSICIILAPVFAGEFQNGAASILLTTKYGRTRVALSKIAASFIITLIIYFICISIYTLSIIGCYGIDGYQCPLQANANFWKVFYEWNNIEAYTALVLIGFVGCFLFSILTLFLSSVLRSSFASIVIIFILIIMPQMINTTGFPLIEKIISLMPHETLIGSRKLAYYMVYKLFGKVFTPFQLMPVIYFVIICILIPITIVTFQKYHEK